MSSAKHANGLSTPVQYLKGVGPGRSELLERLDIRTARDVLFHFPRNYDDMSEMLPISALREGVSATVCGVVEEVELRGGASGRTIFGVLLRQESEYLRAIWFNQSNMKSRIFRGQTITLAGSPKRFGLRWEMTHPIVRILDEHSDGQGTILPIYGLTKGLKQGQLKKIVQHCLDEFVSLVDEVLPDEFRHEHNLLSIEQSLCWIHKPATQDQLNAARRRFIFQELLIFCLAIALRRQAMTAVEKAPPLPSSSRVQARIERLIPFELTVGQHAAIEEISADLAKDIPMNRLLQGDVGSGKTIVALYALLLAVVNKHQAVLMAPTEVLARQHESLLRERLSESKVRISTLTGSVSKSERRTELAAIERGERDIIVATHAILHDDVKFARLGLGVIDEQHKFGVRQRAALKQSSGMPHYLVMTATPIPRTIAMNYFGDLDETVIHGSPPGRQGVNTYLVGGDKIERWWDFFGKKLSEGRQGFVITPRVHEDTQQSVASVAESYEALANGVLEPYRIDLLHGQLRAEEKHEAMRRFRDGETQVLVATSLVEVGIDVPNATVMTILNAERFGIAQLHQLRGRVGRGTHAGFLGILTDSENEEAKPRLESFQNCNDGFQIAELDFETRGPGDLLGTRQHGFPPFRIADLNRDAAVVDQCHTVAQELISSPLWLNEEFQLLRNMVRIRYGNVLDLGDVG